MSRVKPFSERETLDNSDLVVLHLETDSTHSASQNANAFVAGYIYNGAIHHFPGRSCIEGCSTTGIEIYDGVFLGRKISGFEVVRKYKSK